MKKKFAFFVAALFCAVFCAFGFAACGGDPGVNPKKISGLEIGYTSKQVKNVLGEPDQKNATDWYYFSGEYKSLVKQEEELEKQWAAAETRKERENLERQIKELLEKIKETEFPYTHITFDGYNKITAVVYDAKSRDKQVKRNKKISSSELFPKNVSPLSNPSSIGFTAKERYTDGSYYLGATRVNLDVSPLNTCKSGNYTLKWRSYLGKDERSDCSDSVKVDENISKGTKINGNVGIHTFTAVIKNDCTLTNLRLNVVFKGGAAQLTFSANDVYWKYVRPYVASATIPNIITGVGDKMFEDCALLTDIEFNGTKAQWNEKEKGLDWNAGTGDYIIRCTDGTIAKDGTEA